MKDIVEPRVTAGHEANKGATTRQQSHAPPQQGQEPTQEQI